MSIKHTLRRVTMSVPTGQTVPTMIRTFIRAADGTEYPVDQTIEIPQFAPNTVEWNCFPGSSPALEDLTETYILAEQPVGTILLETRDIVTLVDDE